MGWAGGSYVAIPMVESIAQNVTDSEVRKVLYQDLLDALRGQDWDTVDEATGIDPLFDEIAGYSDPESDDEEDDDFDEDLDEEEDGEES